MTEEITAPTVGTKPRLADPATCGEDHFYNLARVTQIARMHCDGCEDYHITISATRLTGRSVWNRWARPALVEFVRKLLAARADDGAGPIDIVIAGAADTSILSTCAHAAFTAGERAFNRVRFTVLDRCRTPLELCRDYAALHGLRLETASVDFTRPTADYPADLVILHNVLTFLPPAAHVEFVRNCGRWLKPRGRMFIWNTLMRATTPGEQDYRVGTSARMRTLIETAVKSGQVTINEPIDSLYRRLDRLTELKRAGLSQITSEGAFTALLSEVGLPILSVESFDHLVDMPEGAPLRRPHVAAVLGARAPG